MQYCSYSIGPSFYHQSHPQLCIVFALVPSLHSFWSYSPLIARSILGTYWPGEFLFQYPIILPFHTVHGVLKAKILVCHSLLQWTTFCQTSPPWPSHLWWPHMAWLSFTELDKAMVHVIWLTSFLWLWFQCVCPLLLSHNTYRLTWVFLILNVGYLFTAALAKRSHCSLPWMRGISSWLPLLTLNVV